MICRKCRETIFSTDNFVRKSHRHNYHWSCLLLDKEQWEKRVILFNLPKATIERIPDGVVSSNHVEQIVYEIMQGK